MSLRDVAHLRRAIAAGTADLDQLRQAVDALWDVVEKLDARIATGRHAVAITADEVVLRTPGASLELKKSGDVAIQASGKISIKGAGDVALRGSRIADN